MFPPLTILLLQLTFYNLIKCSTIGKDCGGSNAIIHLPKVLLPDPLLFGQINEFEVTLNITQDLSSDDKMRVNLEKKLGPFWLTAPCIAGIGSCTTSINEWFRSNSTSCEILQQLEMECDTVLKRGFYDKKIQVYVDAGVFPSIFKSILSVNIEIFFFW